MAKSTHEKILDKITELAKEGYYQKDIAKIVGKEPSSVCRVMKRYDIKASKRKKNLSYEQCQIMANEFRNEIHPAKRQMSIDEYNLSTQNMPTYKPIKLMFSTPLYKIVNFFKKLF